MSISKILHELENDFSNIQFKEFNLELLNARITRTKPTGNRSYFEQVFWELGLLSDIILAIKKMAKTQSIPIEKMGEISSKVIHLFDPCSPDYFLLDDDTRNFSFLERKEIAIRDMVLALIFSASQPEILGKVKVQKLLELYRDEAKRFKAIELRKQNLEKIKEPSIITTDPIAYSNISYLQHRVWFHGHYEGAVDPIVDARLIRRGLATREEMEDGNIILKLTPKGEDFCKHLLDVDPDFDDLVNIAKQLDTYFGKMSSSEFEHFMKDKVDPNIHKRKLGEDL